MFYKILIYIFFLLANFNIFAQQDRIIIASTTSTFDTGLLDYLNLEFTKKFNINVHVLALGTGQAIKIAENGDADLLLVHHPSSELKFMEDGYGLKRYLLMYNDYILAGPKNHNHQCHSIENKLLEIKNNKYIFISRGDESGTHKKEKELWESVNLKTNNFSSWYKKVGQGMGPSLTIANELNAYILSDRATWTTFKNKENLEIICEKKEILFNQYSIILVNPTVDKKLKIENSRKYINWIVSNEGKRLINKYNINGVQLFFFNHE